MSDATRTHFLLIDDLRWTGPRDSDLDQSMMKLRKPVPPERWPFGPPSFHEDACKLRKNGLFCDCKASDSSDTEWGAS